jgi:hypothetical protein
LIAASSPSPVSFSFGATGELIRIDWGSTCGTMMTPSLGRAPPSITRKLRMVLRMAAEGCPFCL